MRMKRGGLAALLILAAAGLPAQAFTFTDAVGKVHTLSKPAQRLIVLSPSTFSVLKILGATDKVVGTHEYVRDDATLFPDSKAIPQVQGTGQEINLEALVALKPDAVITTYWTSTDLDKKLGSVPVIRLNVGQPETYASDVRILAGLVGKAAAAEPYLAWVNGIVADLERRVAALDKAQQPKVFAFYGGEYGYSDGPPYGTYGKDNQYARLNIEKAGGKNLGSQLPGDWITVDPEWVLQQNPDVIVRSVYTTISGPLMGWDGTKASAAKALETLVPTKGALTLTQAWKTKKVYLISGDLDGIAWFLNSAILFKLFHPQASQGLDPTALHAEFLQKWMKLNYNPAERGAFLYPNPF